MCQNLSQVPIYSTNVGTVQRWVLTSHTMAQCQLFMEEDMMDDYEQSLNDLLPSRMKFDQACVEKVCETLCSWGNVFEQRDNLINISSGVTASDDFHWMLLDAVNIGYVNMMTFWNERFNSADKSFYSPITRNKLQTFKDMAVKKLVKSNEKFATIAAERNLFGRLLILAKSRECLPLEYVLAHSLSPIPWSIGLPDGALVKTCKHKLLGKS